MLQLKPRLEQHSICPHCVSPLDPVDTLWMGMHIFVRAKCTSCHAEIIEDLKVSHTLYHEPNKIDLEREMVFSKGIGHPTLIENFKNYQSLSKEINKEIFQTSRRVIVLNCLDYLYGHCLLKILNAQRYLEDFPEYGLITIVPKFLRWLVPDGVAEIWTIDIPLKNSLLCYPEVNNFIQQEFERFDEIYVSKAYSHPHRFDITKFTKVLRHDFNQEEFRITFVWREDRLWCNDLINKILKKTNLLDLALILQNWKIKSFFIQLRVRFPLARFTVVGLGCKTQFPEWIEDCRVNKFDRETERETCQLYAESRLIVGVHGSNMLLPSAHAGMTIDLLSEDRFGNIGQDILYQEPDPRLASFRYRYLSFHSRISELSKIGLSMLLNYSLFYEFMSEERS